MPRYLFDNSAEQASDRFSVLESCYDVVSREILDQTGLAPGWKCLEVGGGGGSLANWLGERVGPDGQVTVTDIEPRWAASRPRPANVRVLRHDITRDPLPGDGFDLVHARLVMNHLPERLRVLGRMVEVLRPGGWLVLEDFDTGWTPVLAAPDQASAALFERVYTALLGLLEKAGAEPRWGRHALGAMRRAGLEDVDARTYAEAWHGGGTGINLHRANVEQMAGRLKEEGIGQGELDRFLALLKDPDFVVNSCALVSTWGRRPRAASHAVTRRRYMEKRLPLAEEPLCLMARLARSGLFDQYMVYENGSEWSFAGGALASVRLGADERDLTAVEEQLAAVPVEGWRAYGWATFELGVVLAGADADDGANLLHLVVPSSEVRAADGTVLVRSVDQEQLDRLVRLIGNRDDGAAPDSPEPIRLVLEDTGNYRAAVAAVLAELQADTPLQKVILSRRVPIPVPVDLTASYVAGRRSNTPARSFLLNLGGIRATGFSPETVVEVAGGRRVVSHPLAGTRARTGSAADDARLRADLLSDPKEIHEHAISVKLALEDLATVCDETNVTEYLTVQERGTVQHLASTVTGRLRDGQSSWQAFAALFPAVTATGIPKTAAYPLIRDLEGRPRGLYAGAVITFDSVVGDLDAALVLRTVFEQEGSCWLQAGAGIVQQSRPEREHEETCEKLSSIAKYLVPAVRPTR
jgi:salicylate synthase